MFKTMYWVLRESDDRTVAICDNWEYADWIAANFPEKCIVRISITQ